MLKIINFNFGFRCKDYLWFCAIIKTFNLFLVHKLSIFVQIGKQNGPFESLIQIGKLNIPGSLLLWVEFGRQLGFVLLRAGWGVRYWAVWVESHSQIRQQKADKGCPSLIEVLVQILYSISLELRPVEPEAELRAVEIQLDDQSALSRRNESLSYRVGVAYVRRVRSYAEF